MRSIAGVKVGVDAERRGARLEIQMRQRGSRKSYRAKTRGHRQESGRRARYWRPGTGVSGSLPSSEMCVREGQVNNGYWGIPCQQSKTNCLQSMLGSDSCCRRSNVQRSNRKLLRKSKRG